MNGSKSTHQYDPIIFTNMPISDEDHDVIGLKPAIDSINAAIEDGANMIGIIAEYGAGKSSLTASLKCSKKITINMWDSLIKNQQYNKTPDAVSELTKSFLFQLAAGISPSAAKYVNRRLSKNFGIISFSISSKKFWLFVLLSAICYIFYCVTSMIDPIAMAGFISSESVFSLINVLHYSPPVWLVLGIACVICGLSTTNIAFSHWKAQDSRENEINDVFEVYEYLLKVLQHERNRLALIIVEDLDRIDNKEIVLGFLREIYRFTTFPQKTGKHHNPVFIISVKPEYLLKDANGHSAIVNDIYPKIFDYTIPLRPIHYDDYEQIILSIIGDQDSKNFKKLQNVLDATDQIKGNKLPQSFHWIMNGRNLTIRQLKERMNRTASLLVTLKNKGYENQSSVSLASCAAVTYLEAQYPEYYPNLINHESEFSTLVQKTISARNKPEDTCKSDIADAVDDAFNAMKISSDELRKDMIKMLISGDISDDFRMYFYSFPKGSYIKNADERDIVQLLLFPEDTPVDAKIGEKIDRIIEGKKQKTIIDELNIIDKTISNPFFPSVILQHNFLFNSAYAINRGKTDETVHRVADWTNSEVSIETVSNLNSYDIPDSVEFWERYTSWLLKKSNDVKLEEKIKIRKALIDIFANKISMFQRLFFNNEISSNVPIITAEELASIPDRNVATSMIDKSQLNKSNACYISDYLNQAAFSSEKYNLAKNIYYEAIKKTSVDVVGNAIVSFLDINHSTDEVLFTFALSNPEKNYIEKKLVVQYLNNIEELSFPEAYYEAIDSLLIDYGLSQHVQVRLINKGYYTAPLLHAASNDNFSLISFNDNKPHSAPGVINACAKILKYDPEIIKQIRMAILKEYAKTTSFSDIIDPYSELWYGDFPIISEQELGCCIDVSTILRLLNRSKVDETSIVMLTNFVNQKSQKADCLYNLRLLFSPEFDDKYSQSDFAQSLADALDYPKIGFQSLSIEDQEQVIAWIKNYKSFSYTVPGEFMRKTGCLIPSLEEEVRRYEGNETYIKLINDIDSPAKSTVAWLQSYPVTFPLAPHTYTALYDQDAFDKYLVGRVLYEKNLDYKNIKVGDEIILPHFLESDCLWPYLKENDDLINSIVINGSYAQLPTSGFPETLVPLYRAKQTADLVKFLFSNLSESDKLLYLKSLNEIASSHDSVEISRFLCESDNVRLLKDDDIFNHVKERLWEEIPDRSYRGYKSYFTRKRNDALRSAGML